MFETMIDPDTAYVVGLLQTDGHHDGSPDRKGKVTVELAARDGDVLRAIASWLPCYSSLSERTRSTNFADDSRTCTLAFFDQAVRRRLVELGVPPGRKSATIAPPPGPISHADHVRGLLDGDGSVGFTRTGAPYVAFVTASQELAAYYCAQVEVAARAVRTHRPNSRDGVANILVTNHAAASVAAWAWYQGHAVSVPRKRAAAEQVASWRPEPGREGRYQVQRRAWSAQDDAVVLSMSDAQAQEVLGRSKAGVSMRRWRLMRLAQAAQEEPR